MKRGLGPPTAWPCGPKERRSPHRSRSSYLNHCISVTETAILPLTSRLSFLVNVYGTSEGLGLSHYHCLIIICLSIIMSLLRPTYEFCRTYNGLELAVRWIKRLEFDLRGLDRGYITPEQYLSSVDLLLMGEAADWVESSLEISVILAGSYTKESLQRFLLLFKERFPSKAAEVITISFPEVLEALRQEADESLHSYYHRTI